MSIKSNTCWMCKRAVNGDSGLKVARVWSGEPQCVDCADLQAVTPA